MSVATDRQERIRLLFEQHADELYRYIRCLTPPDIDPKDVVQETFIRAFKALDQLRNDAIARAWLYRIARNHLYDLMRRRQTEIKSMQFLPREGSAGLDSSLDVTDALKSLPLSYQQVLYLHYLKGFSTQEVAEILERTTVSVRVTVHRAKKALATKLDFIEVTDDTITSTKKGGRKNAQAKCE